MHELIILNCFVRTKGTTGFDIKFCNERDVKVGNIGVDAKSKRLDAEPIAGKFTCIACDNSKLSKSEEVNVLKHFIAAIPDNRKVLLRYPCRRGFTNFYKPSF